MCVRLASQLLSERNVLEVGTSDVTTQTVAYKHNGSILFLHQHDFVELRIEFVYYAL